MPRVNQLLNWVMGINFLCGIVFLLTIVYEYGFRISASEYHLIHTLYHTVWVIFFSYNYDTDCLSSGRFFV